eukprot:snap_masked-scaffold_18-processed-gene-2.22-mRNA-1 protein AED:1.00 eAED:1.00 QI:0/0/0/0/1/1/3/0/90
MDIPNHDSYITKDTGRPSSQAEIVQDNNENQREALIERDHNMFNERANKDSKSNCRYYEQDFMQDSTNQTQKMLLLRGLLFYVFKEALED